MNYVTLEKALEQVGDSGKYQKKLFLTLALQFVSQVFLLLSPTYLYITPQLLCNGNTCTGDYCDIYYPNNITMSNENGHKNLVTEYDLICNKKVQIPIASSSMFFGSIIGCLFFSYIGVLQMIIKKIFEDSYGRRKTLIFAWGVTTFGIFGVSFTFNMIWFIVFNFIAGFGVNGAFNVCFVLLNETAGESFRQKASIGLMIVFGLSEIFCAIMYYAIDNWRWVWISFATIPAIGGLLLTIQIYETPKFYLTQNNIKEAYEALDKIAKSNGNPLFNRDQTLVLQTDLCNLNNMNKSSNELDNYQKKQKYGYQDLFIYQSLRKDTLGFMGMMFGIQLIYYSGQYSLNQVSTGDGVYLIGACVGISELLAYMAIHFYVEKLQRRKTLFYSQIICLVVMMCYFGFGTSDTSIDIPSTCKGCLKEILILTLSCLTRIFICLGFGIQPLYTAEAYPTVIRTIGTGFVFSFGLIGSFLSPYTFYFGALLDINPYFIIVILSMVGPLCTLLIRETLNIPLKDEIEEIQSFSTNSI